MFRSLVAEDVIYRDVFMLVLLLLTVLLVSSLSFSGSGSSVPLSSEAFVVVEVVSLPQTMGFLLRLP